MSSQFDSITPAFIASVEAVLELVKAARVMDDEPEGVHIRLAERTAKAIVSVVTLF
jgi:hypothetical protein